MASRGSVAQNHRYMDVEYRTVEVLRNGEEILEGVIRIIQCPIILFRQILFM